MTEEFMVKCFHFKSKQLTMIALFPLMSLSISIDGISFDTHANTNTTRHITTQTAAKPTAHPTADTTVT